MCSLYDARAGKFGHAPDSAKALVWTSQVLTDSAGAAAIGWLLEQQDTPFNEWVRKHKAGLDTKVRGYVCGKKRSALVCC